MRKKREEVKDKTRNNNFAAAFHELKRREIVSTQGELAKMIDVNDDTITNILHYYTEVSEDTIGKLHRASGEIFNINFLRGESNIMLAEGLGGNQSQHIDPSSLANAALAAKDETIASLKREIHNIRDAEKQKLLAKEEIINALRDQLETKDALIKTLRQHIESLQGQLSRQYYSGYPHPTGVAEGTPKSTEKPTSKA